MRQYLLIYNRRVGKIIRHRRFQTTSRALTARFDAEREFREEPDVEIVVLGADSWNALRQTHSRYFQPVQELAGAALEREARLA
jgi:acetolactate synthase regulatory subunit